MPFDRIDPSDLGLSTTGARPVLFHFLN